MARRWASWIAACLVGMAAACGSGAGPGIADIDSTDLPDNPTPHDDETDPSLNDVPDNVDVGDGVDPGSPQLVPVFGAARSANGATSAFLWFGPGYLQRNVKTQ